MRSTLHTISVLTYYAKNQVKAREAVKLLTSQSFKFEGFEYLEREIKVVGHKKVKK